MRSRAVAALALAAAFAGASTAAAAGPRAVPVIPPVEGEVAEHARDLAQRGLELGNRPDVFAKVGDSITESSSFLTDLACGEPEWGRWRELEGTRAYFGRRTFPASYASVWCERADSFSRASRAAVTGWDAADVLAPLADPPRGCRGLSALECEYELIRPQVSLVMYGTNDVEWMQPRHYRAYLAAIVGRSEELGVIPVLSTIPPRRDRPDRNRRVNRFNRKVVAVARDADVPLWNYWRALRRPRMVGSGIAADGIHPNLYGACEPPLGCRAFDFTRPGLRYGYNQRNLGALRVLDRLREVLATASPPG